jgi:hypothetical protein
LWNQLAESAIGRLAGALLRTVTAARASSTVVHWIDDALGAGRRLERSARWRLTGVAIIAAVATHVGLMSLRNPVGWLWLVIPGVAGVFAILLLALSVTAGRTGLSE